jgi:hypothetical protein
MRGIQDGKEALTKEGCQWSLGLSEVGGCSERMWHVHHCCVHSVPLADNSNIDGNETNHYGLCGGQMVARVDAASVVVGATNLLGRYQCNWIRCK